MSQILAELFRTCSTVLYALFFASKSKRTSYSPPKKKNGFPASSYCSQSIVPGLLVVLCVIKI
jgi:hypothetical protein